MTRAFTPDADTFDPPSSGAACRRSSLSPGARFVIFFGVLFALKLGLPYTGVPAAAQVLVIAAIATGLVWRFWWRCGESRRGSVLLLGILWIGAAAKIIVQL